MFERIRLFPITIAILIAFMGLKAVDLWTGVGTQIGGVNSAMASGDGKQSSADTSDEDHGEPSGDEHENLNEAGEPVAAGAGQSSYLSGAEVDIMNSMEDRHAKLQSWEDDLKVRSRLLEVAEGKIDTKIEELKSLENTLRELVGVQAEKEQADLTRLVKVYETMKPQDAASIIQGLDETSQLAITGKMKESKLAAIFAKMEDETPQRLTVLLMERSELPEELLLAE